ncbi:MFS transporter, partial [Bifidobacterium longum LL6991]
LAILTFLGILSETSLNIAYSSLMDEFSIGASVVQWITTGISLPLITNIILEKAPLEQRGSMLGIVRRVTCAGPALGPGIG